MGLIDVFIQLQILLHHGKARHRETDQKAGDRGVLQLLECGIGDSCVYHSSRSLSEGDYLELLIWIIYMGYYLKGVPWNGSWEEKWADQTIPFFIGVFWSSITAWITLLYIILVFDAIA